MFVALPPGTLLEASPTQIVGVMRSLNTPSISFGGGRKVPSRAYVVGLRHEDQTLTLYICLVPRQGGASFVFRADPEFLMRAQYPRAELQALEMVKRYGFAMERIELDVLSEGHRDTLLREMPLRMSDIGSLAGQIADLLASDQPPLESEDDSVELLAQAMSEVFNEQSKVRPLTEEHNPPPLPDVPEETVLLLMNPSALKDAADALMPPVAPSSFEMVAASMDALSPSSHSKTSERSDEVHPMAKKLSDLLVLF